MNRPTLGDRGPRLLTADQFHRLTTVPAEAEWFANLDNPRTRRAYQIDLQDFMALPGSSKRTSSAPSPAPT